MRIALPAAGSSSAAGSTPLDGMPPLAFAVVYESDASSGTRALTALLRLALDGREGAGSDGTRVSSARALARAHRPRDVDEDEALTTEALFRSGDALRALATAQNFGSGFVAGLGGVRRRLMFPSRENFTHNAWRNTRKKGLVRRQRRRPRASVLTRWLQRQCSFLLRQCILRPGVEIRR